MAMYTFPASYYRDAFPFVSPAGGFRRLAGILFDTYGTIVASDNPTMIAMRPGETYYIAPPRDVIIPAHRALFVACTAAKRGLDKYIVIDQPDPTSRAITIGVVHVTHAAPASDALEPDARAMFTLRTELLDVVFPIWRDAVPAMPEQAPASAPTFRARYLAKFGRVSRNGSIRVVPAGGDSAAAYVYLGRDDAFGVIMPRSYGISTARRAAGLLSSPLPAVPAWALAV